MLAVSGDVPADDAAWAYEPKYDGMRGLVYVTRSSVRVYSRHGREFTRCYPELQGLARALGRSALLDGEIVAPGPDGRPCFDRIQERWRLRLPDPAIAALMRTTPVTFVAFDLLRLAGKDTLRWPYERRREALADLRLAGPHWRTASHQIGGGATLLEETRRQKVEGLVAKRLGSTYRPVFRSPDWVKLKNRDEGTFLVVGWREDRRGHLAAIFVATEAFGGLAFDGVVEFGLWGEHAAAVQEAARLLACRTSPLRSTIRARYCEPRIRVRIEHIGRTASGLLREPVFRGLADVDAGSRPKRR